MVSSAANSSKIGAILGSEAKARAQHEQAQGEKASGRGTREYAPQETSELSCVT